MVAKSVLSSAKESEFSSSQPGGSVHQTYEQKIDHAPPSVRENQLSGTAAGYKAAAKRDGIPHKPSGLFPPKDPLIQRLSTTNNCWAFEKHLPGVQSPYELLPRGGWITGDAAAQKGIDLRLFYVEPTGEERFGTLHAAVRFGNGASIGEGFYLSAHGGAVRIDCVLYAFFQPSLFVFSERRVTFIVI